MLAGVAISICLVGCGRQKALMKVQNQVKEIESEWIGRHNIDIEKHQRLVSVENKFVAAYNGIQDAEQRQLVLEEAIGELEPLKGQAMGSEYRQAFEKYLANITAWKKALQEKDNEAVVHCAEQNAVLGMELAAVLSSGQVTAAKRAVESLEALDLTDIPEDYQAAFTVWKDNIKNVRMAMEAKEFDKSTKLLSQNVPLVEKLNVLAEEHGLTIER